jgi:hypothetical protein
VPFGALVYEPGNNIWAGPGERTENIFGVGRFGQQGQVPPAASSGQLPQMSNRTMLLTLIAAPALVSAAPLRASFGSGALLGFKDHPAVVCAP